MESEVFMFKREEKRNLESIPVGSLGMIPLKSCERNFRYRCKVLGEQTCVPKIFEERR